MATSKTAAPKAAKAPAVKKAAPAAGNETAAKKPVAKKAAPAKKTAAGKAVAKKAAPTPPAAIDAPSVKTELNPAASWPFPTGARP